MSTPLELIPQRTRLRYSRIVPLIWPLAGAAILLLVYLSFLRLDFTGGDTPAFWPTLTAGLMLISGVMITITKAKGSGEDHEIGEDDSQSPGASTPVSEGGKSKRYAHISIAGTLVGYYLILPYAGYLITSFLAISIISRFMGVMAIWKCLLISALYTGATYALFAWGFGVVLPRINY